MPGVPEGKQGGQCAGRWENKWLGDKIREATRSPLQATDGVLDIIQL